MALSVLVIAGFLIGTATSQSCPFGWIDEPRLGSCYYIPNSQVRYTYLKGITRCHNLQASLVIFDSKEELDRVTTEVTRVSGQVANRIGWWVGLNINGGDDQQLENIDGTAFNFSDVNINVTQSTKRQCGAIRDGAISLTTACSRWYGIVCERKKDTPLLCNVDKGWTPLKDSCVKIHYQKRNWNDARRQCQIERADLAKVTSGSDMEEIWDNASMNMSSIWIGLRSTGTKFTWPDKTDAAKSTYWAAKEPLSKGSSRNPVCVAISGVETRRLNAWVTQKCTEQLAFVCSTPQGVCPDGWVPHQTKCINIGNTSPKLPWTRSKAYCRFIGGELLFLDSPSMQSLVNTYSKRLMDSGIYSLWIGLSDEHRGSGNPWRWNNGSKVSVSTANWYKSTPPPNTANQRDCGYLKVRDGTWSATPKCDLEKNFVCEISMGQVPKKAPFAAAPKQCQTGWVPAGRSCIQVVRIQKSWSQARLACQNQGADLVVIGDDYVQAAIEGEMNFVKSYWIGLSDREKEGKYTWVNGSEVINPYWGPGHPIKSSIINCAMINSRGSSAPWGTTKCNSLQYYICQKIPVKSTRSNKITTTSKTATATTTTTTTTTTTQAPFSPECGQFWELRTGADYCYQFHPESLTWKDAMESCRTHNGSLVSITSKEEQSYIEGRLRGFQSSAVWIGATDRLNEAGWRWEDGSPFAFVNWYPGEPNDLNGNEDCSAINVVTMGWYDYSCNTRSGFICKKQAISTDTTTTTVTTTADLGDKFYGCPFGWLDYGGRCFLMKNTRLTWSDARLACRREGADLASIDSDMENKFIWSLFPMESCSNTANQSSCVNWALAGECGKNAGWMSTHCKAACGYCTNPCANLYTSSSCNFWATIGECKRNPMWMAKHCAHACGCNTTINSGYWIGLNDRLSSRSFRWSDLSSVTFINWSPNKPSAHHDQKTNCVIMHSTTGQWSDEYCDETHTGYVCEKGKQLMSTQTLAPFKIGCPIGAFGYGPTCYMLFDLPKTWTEARDACKILKANLVTINDRIVGAFITSELYKGKTSYWTGLSSNSTTYSWLSGVSVTYTAWVAEHTGSEVDQCVAIRSQRPVGLWEDQSCTTPLPYICEIRRRGYTTPPSTPPPTTGVSTTPIPCSKDWAGHEDFCYKVFANQLIWQDAQITCQQYGGSLCSVHGDGTNEFLLRLLDWSTNKAWIGLSDRDQESSYVWSDGSPFDFSRWKDSKPKNLYGTEDCTLISKGSGQWENDNCYLTKPFICSIPRGTIPPSVLPTQVVTSAPLCPEDGWIYHNLYCYYVSPRYSTGLSWYQANRKCMASGGHLASISTPAENDYILSVISQMGYTSDKLWIGFNKIGDDFYHWVDGSPPIFTAWSETEPNDAWGGQKCVNFYSYSGRWNDDNCNTGLGYVCKKVNGTSNTGVPFPTPILHSSCPPGFISSGLTNKCFLVAGLGSANSSDPPLNWTMARDRCRQVAAPKSVDIASINSRLDHDFATLLLSNLPTGRDLWIGLSDREFRNRYMWMDNSEVSITVWGRDQPSNHWAISGRKDCVTMKKTPPSPDPKEIGRWYVQACEKTNAYLCQTWKVPGPTPPTKPPTITRGDCPNSFKKFDKGCYSVFNQKKTWQDARKSCQFFKGDLASILDVYELARLDLEAYNHHIIEPVWTGLAFNQATSSYEWSDGWPVILTSWSETDPDLQMANSCVKMYKRFWNDTSCDELHPFVCFIRNESPPIPTPTTAGKCPDPSHTSYGDYCYIAKPTDKSSWPEAAYKCGREGMELASVHSQAEAAFVRKLVSGTLPKSVTSLVSGRITSIWLGLSRDEKDGFRWSDESPSDFFYWEQGEPNSSLQPDGTTYDEECVEMYTDSGRWNDMSCLGRQQGYVCKVRKILPSTPDRLTTKHPNPPVNSPNNHVITPFNNKGNNPANAFPTAGKSVQYKHSDSTLTGGQIAGIVIGVIALAVIVTVVIYLARQRFLHLLMDKKGEGFLDTSQGFDNALYHRHDNIVATAGGSSDSGSSGGVGSGVKGAMASGDSGVSFS